MDSPALVILFVALAFLLAYGYRGLREGLSHSAAFGAVCLSLATVLDCLLMLMLIRYRVTA